MARKRETLSAEQLLAIGRLVAGESEQDAATAAGVDLATVTAWRRDSAEFEAELERQRRRTWAGNVDRLRGLVTKALASLEGDLDQTQDGRLRQSAAAFVLRASGVYGNVGEPLGPATAEQVQSHRSYSNLW